MGGSRSKHISDLSTSMSSKSRNIEVFANKSEKPLKKGNKC